MLENLHLLYSMLFRTQNVSAINVSVTSKFNYDLIILNEKYLIQVPCFMNIFFMTANNKLILKIV